MQKTQNDEKNDIKNQNDQITKDQKVKETKDDSVTDMLHVLI